MKKTASIIIVCPDRQGIVAAVTTFLFGHGANVSALEQHIEDGFFFMRVEWELENFDLDDENKFADKFASVRKQFNMEISLEFSGNKKRVGLFCSKEAHCLVDLLGRCLIGELNIEIPYVISNFEDCRKIVEKHDIPFFFVAAEKSSNTHEVPSSEDLRPTSTASGASSFQHEEKCLEIIKKFPSDVIGLARYMKVLSPAFIKDAGQKIINVHHSFLPSFVGAKPYDEAYERGVKIIGATAHYVTAELDQGPIIEQRVKVIRHSHNIENLKLIGRECEKEVFAFALKKQIENKLAIFKKRTIVFE